MATEALDMHIEGMIEDGDVGPEPTDLDKAMAHPENRDGVAILVDVPNRNRTSAAVPKFATVRGSL